MQDSILGVSSAAVSSQSHKPQLLFVPGLPLSPPPSCNTPPMENFTEPWVVKYFREKSRELAFLCSLLLEDVALPWLPSSAPRITFVCSPQSVEFSNAGSFGLAGTGARRTVGLGLSSLERNIEEEHFRANDQTLKGWTCWKTEGGWCPVTQEAGAAGRR